MKRFFGFFAVLFSLGILAHSESYSISEGYFWDYARAVSSSNSYFPSSVHNDRTGDSFVFYQEVDSSRKEISISMIKNDGKPKKVLGPFKYYRNDVPTIYSAAISNSGKLAVSVIKSTSASNGLIQIYYISESGEVLGKYEFDKEQKLITSARIFASVSGGFTLFASTGSGISDARRSTFSLQYAESTVENQWGALKNFAPSASKKNPYTPFMAQIKGRDVVAFECQEDLGDQQGLNYSQIYSSVKNGDVWAEALLLTDKNTVLEKGSNYKFFKNYRPFIFSDGNQTKIAWERTAPDTSKANIYVADLNDNGTVNEGASIVNLVENTAVDARRPELFKFNGKIYCLWFDDVKQMNVNNVQMAYLGSKGWVLLKSLGERQSKTVSSAFCCHSVFRRKGSEILTLFWQQDMGGHESRIYFLDRDNSVAKPDFKAKNFTIKKHSDQRSPSVDFVFPDDASGIVGYQCAWTSEKTHSFSDSDKILSPSKNSLTGSVPNIKNRDQIWYFHVRAKDGAGNWSPVSSLRFYYDVTPPRPMKNVRFAKDAYGFSSSNFVRFDWNHDSADDDIAGYSWEFVQAGSLDKKYQTKKGKLTVSGDTAKKAVQSINQQYRNAKGETPDKKIDGTEPFNFFNQEKKNGIFIFSVRAIDDVGLASEPVQVVAILNKYKTKTAITNVSVKVDEMGAYNFNITGEELVYDGDVTDVIITNQNGEKIFFSKEKGDFKITEDPDTVDMEYISGIRVPDLKAGTYTLSILHTEKGEISFKKIIKLEESGTLKFERDFSLEPVWNLVGQVKESFSLDIERILFITLLTLIILGIFGCARGLVSTVRESLIVKKEVNALMTGGRLPMEDKIREDEVADYTKVRFSLKKKLSLFTVALLMLIIAAVTLTIGYNLSRIQETTLIDGLKNRVQIAFGSISSGCQTNMQDFLDLSEIEKAEERTARADTIRSERINSLVSITDNFNEAQYAIILSYNLDNYLTANANTKIGDFDYVWAASPNTPSEIVDQLEIDGRSRIKIFDEDIKERCIELRKMAAEKLVDLRNRNATPSERRNFFNNFSKENFGAVPHFDEIRLDKKQSEYTFFWPVFDSVDSDLLAVVLMDVRTDELIDSVNGAQRNILIISLSVAVLALLVGIFSALRLASVIVNPIRKVVAHVQGITNEKDKENLAGVRIQIKSNDEIRTLGDEVNKMTENLVEGARSEKRAKKAIEDSARAREAAAEAQAQAAREAQMAAKAREETAAAQEKANEVIKEQLEKAKMDNDGKVVQKSLVPLNKGRGEKESVASYKDKNVDLYCYYEGADDVSGDYFNYKKLDDRWYAVIKCDVSGHGIPAALLVAVVSTLFGEYFGNWSFKTHGTRINELITKINETVCSYELTGKFVAIFLALIDTKSGDVYMCNAGDSIVHYFDSKAKEQKELHLNIIPATGMFDQFMIDMRGGYKVEKSLKLNKNDVLFLYTDGIEESVRFFRDKDFNIITCQEKNDVTQGKGPRDLIHKTHNVGTQSEELGNDRIKDIVEAVYNKKKYVLHKYHSPLPNELLEFDFSKCDGTIEDSILALAAIDKVFRFYKKPGAKGDVVKTDNGIVINGDGLRIDRKIDAFLKKTFNRYDYYCKDQFDMEEMNYIYYVNVNEDPQADDLTIFAVRRT